MHEYLRVRTSVITTTLALAKSLEAVRAFILVLGTVPAGTCSRNMFSVHTIFCSLNDVLKRIVPARTVPAGTWSNHVLGTKTPR